MRPRPSGTAQHGGSHGTRRRQHTRSLHAVCLRCPHEGCDVEFAADPARLPPELLAEIGHPVTEPVYVCPCHNSTFAAETGERLAGPAPRGLYRFRVRSVSAAAVEIGEVEEDLLLFV
jgi:Rieske Fe-S protein